MELIDKDALLVEIDRQKIGYNVDGKHSVEYDVTRKIIDVINSLEVKEVDLDYIKKELDELIRIHKPNGDFGWGTLYNVATHFFELGLKAQKGE